MPFLIYDPCHLFKVVSLFSKETKEIWVPKTEVLYFTLDILETMGEIDSGGPSPSREMALIMKYREKESAAHSRAG